MTATPSLAECNSIADLRARARVRLPRALFEYLDGGAEDEWSLANNSAAFQRFAIRPRALRDVSHVETRREVLGMSLAWPLLCSPTGANRFYHRDGEIAAVRAAGAAELCYGLSTMATHSLEDVAAAALGPKLFQLYIFRDRTVTFDLIERCKAARIEALCLTVDAVVRGKRERELKAGLGTPIQLSRLGLSSFARHPLWLAGQALRGGMSMATIARYAGSNGILGQTAYISEQLDATIGWEDVAELAAAWKGPFAIKGILSPDDAQRAVQAGASAIIVSNHGGRQLDGAVAPMDALPAIAASVAGCCEIILDGGIRRGSHIFRALALGATACSIGRPYLYGLAAGGQAGMALALEILRSELVRTMQLTGCASLDEIVPEMIAHPLRTE